MPVAGDVGHTIKVQETASNAGGSSIPATSAATGEGLPPAPVNTAPPTISGTVQQGQTLTESHGSWTNNPTGYTYQWLQCDSLGESCLPISGANAQTYVPVAGDAGQTLEVQETASNGGGSSSPAASAVTSVVLPPVPVNSAPPTISGTPQQGQTLTESHGTWSSNPTSYTYQWQQCDNTGANCTAITGAKAQTYMPVAADEGHRLRVQETARNAGGSSTPATSAATNEVVPPAPVNSAPPTISGTAQQGQTLTESHGTWSNSPTSYTYQWLRCDNAGANCTTITGAKAQTYVPVAADVGHTLKVQETASNAGGAGAPATSAATSVVLTAAPLNTSPPTISGTAQQGQTLTESHGTWTNSPTSYTYQWLQCDSLGANCLPISGAKAQTYVLVAGDVGHALKVQETASNAGGSSTPATSAATSVVVPPVPINTSPPTISGTPQQGQTLTESHGSWTNNPTGYTYQWQQCDSAGANCITITGAKAQTYVPVAADVGHMLRVQETASNAGGSSTPAQSVATSVVVPPVPVNTAPPTISGTAQTGQTLSAGTGTWSESPSSYAYEWKRCDSSGASCSAIAGATGQTYLLGQGDLGSTLRVSVTASNAGGSSAPASSAQTAVVAQGQLTFGKTTVGASPESDPANLKGVLKYALPTAGTVSKLSVYLQPTGTSGQQVLEGVIYADSGGAPGALLGTSNPLTFSSTNLAGWFDLPLPTPLKLAAGNYWIGFLSGNTGNVAAFRYDTVPSSLDYNTNTFTSGPSNPFGSPTVISLQLSLYATYLPGAAPPPPVNTAPPTISGTMRQGQTLTESHGTWSNTPTGYSYQWQQCDSAGANCTTITGANAQTYVPVAGDVGHTLKVQETASNGGGPGSPATSAATTVILAPVPVNTAPPTISGTAKQGQTLTENHGTWNPTPTSYTYQWLQCNNLGASCLPIAGATAQTYVLVAGDVGHTVEVQETASNATGPSSPAASAATSVVPPPPPVNSVLPTISGTAQTGQALSAGTGTWTESPTSYAYQWQRCNSTGASCAPIAGATAQTYAVASPDLGSTLRVSVTATNAGGSSAPASSAQTAVVAQGGPSTFGKTSVGASSESDPANLKGVLKYALPTAGTVSKLSIYLQPTGVSGQQTLEGVIYADAGGAPGALLGTSNPLVFKSTNVAGWYDLPLPTPLKLAAGNYWIGFFSGTTGYVAAFRYDTVAGSLDYNANTFTSGPTSTFGTPTIISLQLSLYATYTEEPVPPAPVNSAAPTIAGTARQGQTLTEGHGTWSNSPTGYTYQWQQCDGAGANCTTISGANAQTYVPVAADVGHTLKVQETASNAGGSGAPAASAATSVVVPPAPVNSAAPTISGTVQQGQTLTESHGAWSNSPTSYTYLWQQCDGSGANCTTITSATAQTYVPVAGDVGHTMKVQETAGNAGGSSTPAASAATSVVVPPAPVNSAAPTISGTVQQGQTLTESHGAWSNSPTSYTYQWQQCDSAGANCTTITNATAQTYTPVAADVGHTLKVQETARNAGGSSTPSTSAATSVVVPPVPVNSAAPTISGTMQQGQTLTESHGTWSNSPTSYTYQWLQCDSLGTSCLPISGAKAQTYVLAAGDVNHTIQVQETAGNAGGSSTPSTSAATSVVVPPVPVNSAAPTISGTVQQGQTLTESHGTWSNTPTGYAYQWLQCDSAGANCTTIAGANAQTYVPVAADVGHTLRVQETASNAGGSSTPAASAATSEVVPAVPVNTSPPTISGTSSRARRSQRATAHGPTTPPATPTSGCSATAPAPTARRSRAPTPRPTWQSPRTWATRSGCRRPPRTPAGQALPQHRQPRVKILRRSRSTPRRRRSRARCSRARRSRRATAPGATARPATPTFGSSATVRVRTARQSQTPLPKPIRRSRETWATQSGCRRPPVTPAGQALPQHRRPRVSWSRRRR